MKTKKELMKFLDDNNIREIAFFEYVNRLARTQQSTEQVIEFINIQLKSNKSKKAFFNYLTLIGVK